MPEKTQPEETLIVGFGSQGAAQAANLRDSGARVAVCLRPESPRTAAVREAGLLVYSDAARAVREAGVVALLIPDAAQAAYYNDVLAPHLRPGALLVFAHGFALHARQIVPRGDLDVVLVAPLAHGDAVRRDFLDRRPVPCVVAVEQDATGRASERAMAYAAAIAGNGPFISSTVAEEVETDLFAEQVVLCGGVPELARAAFETLVEAGYNPEIAVNCCLRELRPIVELICRQGIAGMERRISETAAYGAVTRGPRVVDAAVRTKMREILQEIRSGAFTRELIAEQGRGMPTLREAQERAAAHPIEARHRPYTAER